MQLFDLRVGKTYKNYKALCEALGEPYKSSDSKASQLKMWESFFKWERIKHQYKIIEIYEFPEPPTNQHKKLSFYAEAMYPIIINELYQIYLNSNKKVLYPPIVKFRKEFFELFGFSADLKKYPYSNNNYNHKLIFNELSEISSNIIYEKFNKALKNVEKIYSISHKEIYHIESIPTPDEKYILKQWKSEDIETNIIKSNIDLALYEMGLKNTFDVFFRHKVDEFTKRLNNYLKQYNYKYNSTAMKIYLPNAKVSLVELAKNDKYTITAKYNELFGNMDEQEINYILNDCKKAINDRIIEVIKNTVNTTVEKFSQAISYPNCTLEIYKGLQEDYGANLPKEQYINIYQNLIDEYIEKCIKIRA